VCTRIQIPLLLLSFSAAKQLSSLFGQYLALCTVAESDLIRTFAAYRRTIKTMANLSNLTECSTPAAGFGFVDFTGISTMIFSLASECWKQFL
jgi:hypothetical protein